VGIPRILHQIWIGPDPLPDEFAAYRQMAYGKGFLMVAAAPLTRSSYHAGDDFAKLKAAREAMLTPPA